MDQVIRTTLPKRRDQHFWVRVEFTPQQMDELASLIGPHLDEEVYVIGLPVIPRNELARDPPAAYRISSLSKAASTCCSASPIKLMRRPAGRRARQARC